MKPQDSDYTKYEIARIIGARALQLSMNAPILAALKKEQLEEMEFNTLRISEYEFKAGVLPITIRRPFPTPRTIDEEETEEEKEDSDETILDVVESTESTEKEEAEEAEKDAPENKEEPEKQGNEKKEPVESKKGIK